MGFLLLGDFLGKFFFFPSLSNMAPADSATIVPTNMGQGGDIWRVGSVKLHSSTRDNGAEAVTSLCVDTCSIETRLLCPCQWDVYVSPDTSPSCTSISLRGSHGTQWMKPHQYVGFIRHPSSRWGSVERQDFFWLLCDTLRVPKPPSLLCQKVFPSGKKRRQVNYLLESGRLWNVGFFSFLKQMFLTASIPNELLCYNKEMLVHTLAHSQNLS